MREIKFRAWQPITMRMLSWEYLLAHQTMMCQFLDPDLKFMQYTGMHDKNGKEIYEGDILKSTQKNYCLRMQVRYDNGCFYPVGTFNILGWSEEWEVIGNIYENPELLKP